MAGGEGVVYGCEKTGEKGGGSSLNVGWGGIWILLEPYMSENGHLMCFNEHVSF